MPLFIEKPWSGGIVGISVKRLATRIRLDQYSLK